MSDSRQAKNLDWRAMFLRYMRIVSMEEGVYFLSEGSWSPEEWAAIEQLKEQIAAEYAVKA
jgi:hypothetical protein